MERLLTRHSPLPEAPATWGFLVGMSIVWAMLVTERYLGQNQAARPVKQENETEAHADDDDEDDDDQSEDLSTAALSTNPRDWGMNHAPFKMVLCVNQELYDEDGKATKMKPGKTAAQCCHATLGAYKRAMRRCPKSVNAWERTGQKKIAVKCPTEAKLMEVREAAAVQGVAFYLVQDAGHTQVAPGSRTVLAVGPAPEDLCNQITGNFKLY